MTEDELRALEEAESKMTKGPWQQFADLSEWWIANANKTVCSAESSIWSEEDGDGVIALRNAAPALLAEVRRLRAILAIIDEVAPRADASCNEPGITLSEAAARLLRDRKARP